MIIYDYFELAKYSITGDQQMIWFCLRLQYYQVHKAILNVREGRRGWIHLFAPENLACRDDGDLFAAMVNKYFWICACIVPLVLNYIF